MLIKKFIFNAKYCTAGRPQLLDPRTSDANVVNSTSLLDDERKLTLNMCSEVHWDYFSPELFRPCYCCPDVSRKEYCHLKLEDCRATCTTCKPKCSWKPRRCSVMEGWSSGCNIEHKLKHYHFLFLNFGIRRHTCCMRIMFYAYCVIFYVLMISLEIKTH